MTTIGELLLAERARRGHNQREAAAEIGVAQQSFGWWERNLSVPSARHMPGLGRYLSMPAAQLERLIRRQTGGPQPLARDIADQLDDLRVMVVDLAARVSKLERDRG